MHWIFDAFGIENNPGIDIDLTQNIGGVPLGLNIAEDIYKNGLTTANGAKPLP